MDGLCAAQMERNTAGVWRRGSIGSLSDAATRCVPRWARFNDEEGRDEECARSSRSALWRTFRAPSSERRDTTSNARVKVLRGAEED